MKTFKIYGVQLQGTSPMPHLAGTRKQKHVNRCVIMFTVWTVSASLPATPHHYDPLVK